MAPTIHLVCGGTGAGKSTYARTLAAREAALPFMLDRWMGTLFWADAPADLGDWAFIRVERCAAQIRAVAGDAAALGISSVIDAGFATATDRAAFADWAQDLGLGCRLHWLDVPAETRWQRVLSRNAAGGGDTTITVSRAMFDAMEAMWEPPGEAEMARLRGLRIRHEHVA